MSEAPRSGVLRTSVQLFRLCLRADALLRQGLFAAILVSVLASIACAAFGLALPLGSGKNQPITTAFFQFLSLPLQFLLFDRLLGHAEPRATWRSLCLDFRLLRMFWVWLKYGLVLALPVVAVLLLIAALAATLGSTMSKLALGFMIVAIALALIPACLYFATRLVYLPILVAQGRGRELRTALAGTRGRFWAVVRSLAAAYTLLFLVSVPVSVAAEWLPAHAPLWLAAAGLLLDAFVVALASGLSAVVLAESYRRVVLEMGPQGPEFALETQRPAV